MTEHTYTLRPEWTESTIAWLMRKGWGDGGLVGYYLDEWNSNWHWAVGGYAEEYGERVAKFPMFLVRRSS